MSMRDIDDEPTVRAPLPHRYRILVVDDESDFRHLISMFLQRSGMPVDVETAENGPAGLAAALTDPPDLVVLDVMMPELNGFDVCQRLRSDARTHDVPVLMLTSLDEPVDRTRGFLAGVDDYLAKPFDRGELLARVRRILQRTYGYGDVINMLEPTATAH
ncbi:MAG TPA: response regulator transcription factor [Candidatus Dormibacteraeota bacterium]|nr:response regulator transcription factor [Candidatus Dormibacteraeota bacterium]